MNTQLLEQRLSELDRITGDMSSSNINLQRAIFKAGRYANNIMELGFGNGRNILLLLSCNSKCIVDVLDETQSKGFDYLKSHFTDRLRFFHIDTLPHFVVDSIGRTCYELVNINTFVEDINYVRFLLDSFSKVTMIGNVENPFLYNIEGDYTFTLCSLKPAKIAVLSLYIGEHFRNITRYSLLGKIQYCIKQGYDLIVDESCYDTTRNPAWSKVKLILKYLENYDYVVWIDADTFIMNTDITLESFIFKFLNNNDMLVGHDRDFFNTGVWFIKNSDWSTLFLQHVYNQEQFIDNGYWEQAAVIHLFNENYNNAKQHITSVWHTAFNSYYYNYEWGHFLIHFPGCRPLAALELAFFKYCPVRKLDDTDESYQRRMHWIQHESVEYENKKINSNFQVM
jgi:hypothetical protein